MPPDPGPDVPPVSLLLVRHGQSTWNAQGRWQGQADPPLSELGVSQAEQAGSHLAGEEFAAVFASDLVRAQRTAEILAGAVGLTEVVVDKGLRELDVGEVGGLTRGAIEQRWPGLIAAWSEGEIPSLPGGEPREDLFRRATETTSALAGSARPGDRLLVVTHGAFIRALVRALGGEPVPVPNLGGWWFEHDTAGAVMTPGTAVNLLDPGYRTLSPTA